MEVQDNERDDDRANDGATSIASSPPSTPDRPDRGPMAVESPSTPLGFDDPETIVHEDEQQQEEDHQPRAQLFPAPQADVDTTTLARGTDVDVHQAAATFQDFLQNFRLRSSEADYDSDDSDDDDDIMQSEPLYHSKLRALIGSVQPASLDVDAMHLYHHSPACQKLYHQLVNYPLELVPLMDLVVKRELQSLAPADSDEEVLLPPVQVRPFNLKTVSNLRCLDPIAMESLVSLKGMIVRSSSIIPDLKAAHFSCVICGNAHQVAVDRGRIQEPSQCHACSTKESYQIIHNRSIFADKQLVRLQETPDQVPPGQTPASVVTFCFDDLVDSCQPGDKVEVTGVLRAQPIRVNPKISKLKSIYKTYVDVIHFRAITGMDQGKHQKGANNMLSTERVRRLQEFSKDPRIYEKLTQSLAPSIWELDDVKKGVLCMLFGGNDRRVPRNSDDHAAGKDLSKRGDINILLCGDPGTSKSQLLGFVHKLSSRGVYTSGKGSSAVGLTASVVRDPETKELVLESGALVLSDRGICCIDEFDKMSDTTRSILHEAMEQQTVSIAKAGIVASLNSRTSILASANPVESRYNPNLSVVENIKLPPTLLSRFDLIYLILDAPNPDQDRHLARHLVGLYYDTPDVVEPPMDSDLLRDYIDFARENIRPALSDEAVEYLLQSYVDLRNPSGVNGASHSTKTISATPRQLESLIRTSEALAKMKFASAVSKDDVAEALRLLKVATQAAATDPRTGRIDMDMITTGRSAVDREMEEGIYNDLKHVISQRAGKRLLTQDLVRELTELGHDSLGHDEVVSALRRMDSDGLVQFNERTQAIFVRHGTS